MKGIMWFQIRTGEIPGKTVFNGCPQLFARLQGSSYPITGCSGSQWPGNTPGFLCALKTPTGKVFQPSSASRTVCPSRPSVGTGPTLTPNLAVLSQHPRFPWQLQDARHGAGALHSIPALPGSFRRRVTRAGGAHRTLGVGHSWPDPAVGDLFQSHCAGKQLFHPPEKHMWIFLAGQQDKRAQLFQPSICFVCSGPHSLSK